MKGSMIQTYIGKTEFLNYIRDLRKNMRPESTGKLYTVNEWGVLNEPDLYYQFFEMLADCMKNSFSVVTEEYYVEKSYRDTYYQYYSGQHFAGERFSIRLSFFKEKNIDAYIKQQDWAYLFDEIDQQDILLEKIFRVVDQLIKRLDIAINEPEEETTAQRSEEQIVTDELLKSFEAEGDKITSLTKKLKELYKEIQRLSAEAIDIEKANTNVIKLEKCLKDIAVAQYEGVRFQKLSRICKAWIINNNAEITEDHWFDFKRYSTSSKATPDKATDVKDAFQAAFIGSCVINPLLDGAIGLTLLDPGKLLFKDKQNNPRYIRSAIFQEEIYGRRFEVKAFPYRTQDGQFTRCTEVTLLNIFDYFGTLYPDHRTVLPSEIIFYEQEHSPSRVLPANGITYEILSSIVRNFGFSPYYKQKVNIYSGRKTDESDDSVLKQEGDDAAGIKSFSAYAKDLNPDSLEEKIHRCLHHYVEAGIPVAVGLKQNTGALNGHSIVCFGHGEKGNYEQLELICKAYRDNWNKKDESKYCFIDAASFYDQYVVMDDTQFCYSLASVRDMSSQTKRKQDRDVIAELVVPLNKRMVSDDAIAYDHCMKILADSEVGLGSNYQGKDIILRLFLTSCRSYKAFRTATLMDGADKMTLEQKQVFKNLQRTYARLPMPRFVWVCELYDGLEDYCADLAFGEVVIDATNLARNQAVSSLLLAVYQTRYIFQTNERVTKGCEFDIPMDKSSDEQQNLFRIPSYKKNLQFLDKHTS